MERNSCFKFSKFETPKILFCYLALLPLIILFGTTRVFPIIKSFYMSFFDWPMLGRNKFFIGFGNYQELFMDQQFLLAIGNTFKFSIASIVFIMVLGLPIAVTLNKKYRLSGFYQMVYFLPYITSMVPMSIGWKWIYDPKYGILNHFLGFFGIEPISWLINPEIAIWAVTAMNIWKNLGFSVVLLIVGLKNIPGSIMEAATIDGATGWRLFRNITLPLLKPMIVYVLVTTSITAFNVFTQVYVMTTGSQAAPGRAVRVLLYDIYENAFRYFRLGYASAESVILTIIVVILTVIQFKLVKSE